MAYFGVAQRTGLAFGLNARQFIKAFLVLIVSLIVLFVFHSSIFGLLGFAICLAGGMALFFVNIQELPMANWLETITTHALHTIRWRQRLLEHTNTPSGIKPDYSPFLVTLRRSNGIDYVDHTWGNTLLWKLEVPRMNGFAYLPASEQSGILGTLERMIKELSLSHEIRRFGFTSLDMPSTADGVTEHLASLPIEPPSFYRELANATATKMRDAHIWLYVTCDPGADLRIVHHNVDLALQMGAAIAQPLTMTDIGWHVIGMLADPFTWADKHANNTFSAPFPEVVRPELDYVQTDTIKHMCRMAIQLPRQDVPNNWWALAQPRITQANVALATTVNFDIVPSEEALKVAGKTLGAAEAAMHEASVTKGRADFRASRQLSDATRRNHELVSGAALHRVTVGYHVMSPQLSVLRDAARNVDGAFRAAGLDLQTCNGRQLEALRMLMPFGLARDTGKLR